MNCNIPLSHLDLVKEPYFGILTTLMPDGMPQSCIVWYDWDGFFISFNTTKERQKGKNMIANQQISLIIVDPKNSSRWISIHGTVKIDTAGALEHLDKLTKKYTRFSKFYGNIFPVDQQYLETRIKCTVLPKKIFLDAIHLEK